MTALEPGVDYVIIANRKAEKAPFPELLGWLERALEER
jgi:RNase P protein component